MKVLLVNGSPHEKGCTYTALKTVAESLNAEGVETEIYWIGVKPLSGCLACMNCRKTGECVWNDKVNEFAKMAQTADGFVFGSPVHYAHAGGAITSFMDRLFYSGSKHLAYKPAASVVSSRRAGGPATFDMLNKYYAISHMPIVSSNYWNEVHGSTASDVEKDEEGLQTMRLLGKNMAWLLKCIEAGKEKGLEPKSETKIRTNFIR